MSMPAKGKHHHLPHHHQQHHSHQQQQASQQQSHHNQQQQQTHQHPQQQQHVNVNQSVVANTPQAYNAVVAANATRYVTHAGSEFHVPGQNYVAQPGGHVGGGGGSVGVPGGRGPPSLQGIQSLGQSTPGIQPGGPQSGQQQPPQAQTPGVQQQQPQGPAPTTTPPVHTPSPQEMGKQVHLQAPPQHQQVYMSNPTRPVTQGYFQAAPRSQPSRNLGHRNNQGGAGAQVVGMPGGGGGQPTALYQHQGIPVAQGTPMYDLRALQQVQGLHPTSHQQTMYPPPSILSLFSSTQQRHQPHQGQPFYQSYPPHTIVQTQNMYPYAPGQGNQHPYFFQQPQAATQLNISRASGNAVSGGAQHVGGPLAGAQGAGGVPQGALQQPTQPPQPIPSMAIPLAPAEVYTGHNGATSSANLSSSRLSTGRRSHAIMDIRDPNTGDNIAADIYGNASSVSGASSNRETPQPQNPELVAEFAARVAKAASEESDTSFAPSSSLAASTSTSSTTTVAAAAAVTATSTPVPQSGVTNVVTENVPSSTQITQVASTTSMKITANVSKEPSGQSNNSASATTTMTTPATIQPQNSTISTAPLQQQVPETSAVQKTDSKPLQLPAQEFRPRGETKAPGVGQQQQPVAAVVDEQKLNVATASPIVVANKDAAATSPQVDRAAPPAASTAASSSIELKEPTKNAPKAPTVASIVSNTSVPSNTTLNIATNVTDVPLHPSNTANQVTLASATSNIPSSAPATPAAAPVTPAAAAPVSVQPPPTGSSFLGPIPTRPPRLNFSEPFIDSSSFPTLASINSSSPLRRKNHNQQQQTATSVNTTSTSSSEVPTSGKELQKERKISDRSNTGTSRGTTPTPSHNQTEQHQRSNGETALDKTDVAADNKAEHHQKTADGKAMQKQKNKNKSKHKDLNRKGAEKEGTDMDAFVNPAAGSKPEGKTQQQAQQAVPAQLPSKDDNALVDSCNVRESPKIVKDRENNETKIEASTEIDVGKTQKTKNVTKSEVTKENVGAAPALSSVVAAQALNTDDQQQQQATQQNNKEIVAKETTPTIEESDNSNQGICNLPAKTLPNDIVDHAKVAVKDEIDVETIVAQKNEENAKVSALHATSNESTESETPVIEKQDENEVPSENDSTATKAPPRLKYPYDEDQWSPINTSGKREYGRDFLIRLQDDPKSRVRPNNLPEMDVVLKDCIKTRSTEFRPFKDPNAGRHDSLFPGFAKSGGYNAKPPLLTKKSYQGKSNKPTKPNVIHLSLSLREDVKLREAENAWRPARLKPQSGDEDVKTLALYKKVRSVLNKLTPQKFDTLVSQVRSLEIDSPQKLQGVIDLVFEKAVDEPNFSVAYALMCKELRAMSVVSSDKKPESGADGQRSEPPTEQRTGEVTFRKLIIERCQKQFQKNNDDEHARISKLKDIEECSDPEKKKELQTSLEEYDRRLRIRSVGNIRFIGELFKKEMLTTKIMYNCIVELMMKPDEENLECLCKLLTTIGKVLAERSKENKPLDDFFVKLGQFVGKEGIERKISSRIRFMIQDVMDLKTNNWIPRRDEAKPKTMDQIEKEAECERSEVHLNNTPMNTPRKDDRNNDRRRNRGGGGMEEGGWSQPVGKTRQQPYSVETSKLSTKAPAPSEMRLGNRNAYAWGASAAAMKTVTPNKYALLESITGDPDKRPSLQVSGSRSTGPRDYGRPDYKSGWENKGSRLGSQHMNSSSSGRETLMESGRSQSISMPPPSMKMKSQSTSIVTTSSSSGFSSSSSSSNKPRKTEAELIRVVKSITDGAVCEPNIDVFIKTTLEQFQDLFDSSTTELFVRESINGVLERTAAVRLQFSALFSHMVHHNILPLSLIQTEFEKVLESADDLVIDIPQIWTYFAELLSNMVVSDAHPLAEMKTTAAVLKSTGKGGKLMGELLAKLARDQGPKWTAEKWQQSGLQWSDIADTTIENVNDIIKEYKLEFLNGECKSSDVTPFGSQLTNDQIHDHLVKLMRDSDFDNICSWIMANVGSKVNEPQFIRVLMTAILSVTVQERRKVWKLNEKTFTNHQTLIKRFIDTDADLELQCLFAIQAYVHKLEHPPGLLFTILASLQQNDILSDDAFLTWESHTGEFPGHAVAIKGLTSFFTGLREPDSDDA